MDALPEMPAAPGPEGGHAAASSPPTSCISRAPCGRPACASGRARCCAPSRRSRRRACGKRDDFYWTLHSVFVNRRDQREIFDQAFHVFWRNPRLLEKMMEMLLPQVGVPAEPDQSKQLSRRLQEALQPGRGEAPEDEGRAARSRGRGDLHRLRPRGAAAHGLRADVAGRDRRGACAPSRGCACRCRMRRTRRYRAGAPRPAGRLPRLAAPGAAAGRPDRAAQARAAPPAAAARHPVRHLGLDGPLHAHVPAFHARHHQRPRPRLLLHLRHAAHQRHPLSALQGRRCRAAEGVGARSRTGRAARASARPCTSSTTSGRAGCWGRAPSCC